MDSFEILVPLHVEEVKRVWLGRVTIGKSEVNSDSKADLTTTEDILQEGVSLFDLQLGESHLVIANSSLFLVNDRILTSVLFKLSEGK